MKKILITALSIFTLGGVLKAQSIANGVNDWYAERYLGAKATFEKLQAANPSDIQATYWLGQTYIEMGDLAAAKSVYEKGLASSAGAPLLEAGMGQVELQENKINEARQRFEKAVTAASGKKGGDPEVLNAVGRAIANTYTDKEKKGDINFAVTKLDEAANSKTKDNILLADIYLNLGNAYRLAKPGENGGIAFTTYQKSYEANPNFAPAYYRLAKLFNTQHNVELYEKYLNDAIAKDPRFAPAYYDLSYLKMGKLDLSGAENYAKLFAQNSDPDPQNEYLQYSLLWAQKKYDEAIAGAKSIISRLGDKTKPRVYKLIANSYVSKGDSISAKPFIDDYFAKVKPDDPEYVAKDWLLKAYIYSVIPGQEEVVLTSIMEGAKMDTVVENKVQILKDAIAFFNSKRLYDKEAMVWEALLQIKPNPILNDYFAANLANYRTKTYEGFVKGYNYSKIISEKWPEQSFGWEWMMNNAINIDTVKKDSILVPAALALMEFAKKDTVKYIKQMYNAASQLAVYHNEKDENEKAIEYLKMMKASTKDPAAQEKIQQNIDLLLKPRQPAQRPAAPRSSSTSPAAKKAEAGTN
jgi:tetratricopeptide (TPR) repeat protein